MIFWFLLILCAATSKTLLSIKAEQRVILENVDPCDDFNRFVCGQNKKQSIFEEMHKSMFNVGKRLILKSNKTHAIKLKNFYNSCININQIKRKSLTPLKYWYKDFNKTYRKFQSIKQRKKRFEKQFEFIKTQPPYHQLFTLETAINSYNTNENIPQISQPVIYLVNDLILEKNRTKFDIKKNNQIKTILFFGKHFNETITVKDISQMMQFEYEIFKIWSNSPNIGLENITIENLSDLCPAINWNIITKVYQDVAQINHIKVPVVQTTSLKSLIKTCKVLEFLIETKRKFRIIENYLKWSAFFAITGLVGSYEMKHFIKSNLDIFISKSDWFKSKRHRNFKKYLNPTRENDCLNVINEIFPLSLSSLYASTLVNGSEAKKDIKEIIGNMTKSIESRFQDSLWLTENDKKKLIEKIKSIKINVFYPETVTDDNYVTEFYETVKINAKTFFQNMMSVSEFLYTKNLKSLVHGSLNEDFTGFEINAYYIYQKNQINVPMGIMQHQIYRVNMSTIEKYSKFGFIIGHEISHGYDPLGIYFDSKGNLDYLLEEKSHKEYNNRASCFVHKYNRYNLPGSFELKENIADNMALELAYMAFESIYDQPNVTDIQQFFYSFAKMFCYRPKNNGSTQILVDSHSPNKYRIIGPISNSENFIKGYHCTKHNQINLEDKCSLW